MPSHVASALVDRDILHPLHYSFLRKEWGKAYVCVLVSSEFPHLCSSLFLQCLFWGSTDMPVSHTESSWAREMENVAMLASIWEDAEGLARKVALLEGELAGVHRAWEVAEEKFRSLSGMSAKGAWRLVVSEMERREQFEELSLLWAWGTELCLTIIRPSQMKSPLSVRMPGWLGSSPRFGQPCLLP
jgi:hypothetical protein